MFTILHIPGYAGKDIVKQCRSIDIFPTILDLIDSDITVGDKKDGSSLFPIIDDLESDSREVFAETGDLYGPWPSPEKHNVFCLKNEGKKIGAKKKGKRSDKRRKKEDRRRKLITREE